MENQPQTQSPAPTSTNESVNSAQPVVSATSQQSAPQQPEKRTTLKKIIKALLITFVVLIVAGAAFVAYYIINIFGGAHSQLSACSQGRTQLFSNTQLITDEFNSIPFVPNQPNVKANIMKQQGDCLDSLPTIFGTKTYSLPPTPAGVVFDQASAALEKNGYTASKDNFPDLNPCSHANNPYSFAKGSQTIKIELTCSNYAAKNPNWRQTLVTGLTVSLSDEWQYPQNK
jgi:hypothetical protein